MANPRDNRFKSVPRTTTPAAHARGILLAACLLVGLSSAGCATPAPKAPPGVTSPVVIEAPDPTASIYFSWAPIDHAVKAGALEHVVVATPIKGSTATARSYELLALRDRPGRLDIERADDGGELIPGARTLTLTARIGRFGDADLESGVLASIRCLLEQATAQALAED